MRATHALPVNLTPPYDVHGIYGIDKITKEKEDNNK